MREQWSRAARVAVPVKSVRRSLKFGCGRGGLRSGISRLARAYGLVDANGVPQDSEIIRLLLVTALTTGQPNRVDTAVAYAVAVQRPMLAAALGRRITTEYATGSGRGQRRTYRAGNERLNRARVVLDDWLSDALHAISLNWQDEWGRVRDVKMIVDLASAGLRDPDLQAIVHGYVHRTSRLRERLAQAEVWIRQAVAEAMSEPEELRRTG